MPVFPKRHRVKPAFKLWFEIDGEYVFGEGTCKLLGKVKEEGSLSAAARASGMSYRYAWGLVKDVEKHLGAAIVETRKGGKHGGRTELTKTGLLLVEDYKRLKKTVTDVCKPE